MKKSRRARHHDALRQARSTLWTIQQLTSRQSSADRGARSFAFELHAISTRGLQELDSALCEAEVRRR